MRPIEPITTKKVPMFSDPSKMLELSNYLYGFAALLTLFATFGVIYFGKVAARLKDAQVQQYQKDADVRIAEANATAESARTTAKGFEVDLARAHGQISRLTGAIQDRRLTPTEALDIRRALRPFNGFSVAIGSTYNDKEAERLAEDIKAALVPGIHIIDINAIAATPLPPPGMDPPGVTVNARSSSFAEALKSALHHEGNVPEVALGEFIVPRKPDEAVIFVGPKRVILLPDSPK